MKSEFDVESKVFDLLVADDDADFREAVAQRFSRRGFHVEEAADAENALRELERRRFDVALVDTTLPGIDGLELLKRIRSATPECQVVLLTEQGTGELAEAAMKAGAYDVIVKPFPLAELEIHIDRACARSQLCRENLQLKTALERVQSSGEILGASSAMQEVLRAVLQAAASDRPVLIEGESGTGKELTARAIHRAGPRASGPFVAVDCTIRSESLLDECELFGQESGGFSGAVESRLGLLEVADGGTLFLDEIADLPGPLQAKLLRVIEDGSLRRVGSIRERRIDVRLASATSRDLQALVQAGKFREDLFHRLNAISLKLPPLRDRIGDVPRIVESLLGAEWSIEPDALATLEAYSWPGNVAQLVAVVNRAKILADGRLVRPCDLPAEIVGPVAAQRGTEPTVVDAHHATGPISDALSAVQRSHIVDVLRRERGNKARTARALGINRRSLYRLLEKHRIEPGEVMAGTPKARSIS